MLALDCWQIGEEILGLRLTVARSTRVVFMVRCPDVFICGSWFWAGGYLNRGAYG